MSTFRLKETLKQEIAMAATERPHVLFLDMPWATGQRPSIALAILRQLCVENNVPVQVFYSNLDMAARVGFEVAGRFADERQLYGLSEHLFSVDVFGKEAVQSDEYLHILSEGYRNESKRDPWKARFADLNFLKHLRDEEVPQFLDKVLKRVLDANPDIVGFTATFNQVMSSIALANRIKKIRPEIQILGRPLANMNESPSPDYDDFFAEKERLFKETGRVFNIEFIPLESSRGCWWGAKNHCVFCGINPELMGFRAKDVDRVIREIVTLSARYGVVRLTATDWIISRWHCNELFRRLKELDLDLEIFYEVRADMKKWQIKLMREAGIAMIQPGIESFSTPLLQLMKKGTTAIRHVQFLRWCKEYGIDASYNILACFPGEQAEWYFEMARLIPRLRHLQPPINNIVPIEMHRFAPLYEKRESFGVETHMIRPDYAFNLPAGLADPQKIAYFFSFRSNRIPPAGDYMKTMEALIDSWQTAHRQKQPPLYEYMIGAGFLRITDTRQGEGRYLHLADLHQDVVLLCDEVSSRRTLKADLSARYPQEVADGTLDRVVDELVAADVLMAEGNYLLTLPIARRPRTTEELRSYVLGKTEVPQETPAQAQPA